MESADLYSVEQCMLINIDSMSAECQNFIVGIYAVMPGVIVTAPGPVMFPTPQPGTETAQETRETRHGRRDHDDDDDDRDDDDHVKGDKKGCLDAAAAGLCLEAKADKMAS